MRNPLQVAPRPQLRVHAHKVVLHEMIIADTECREREARLDRAIEGALPDWPLLPAVERLQALRRAGHIAAVTFMVEVGDIRRFDNPRRPMACLGLVPSGRSTGVGRKPGPHAFGRIALPIRVL